MTSLAAVLDVDDADSVNLSTNNATTNNSDTNASSSSTSIQVDDEPHCVECVDAPALVRCAPCGNDFYCAICFRALHLKGKRAAHLARTLGAVPKNFSLADARSVAANATASVSVNHSINVTPSGNNLVAMDDANESKVDADSSEEDDGGAGLLRPPSRGASKTPTPANEQQLLTTFAAAARFVPLRLNAVERTYLRLLEASVFVSDYVDKIDVTSFAKPQRRTVEQLVNTCSILSGIVFKNDYAEGQKLTQEKNFAAHDSFFRAVFELGRRYKILNPERLRNEYGKLMYILQDSQIPELREALGFALVAPIKTVQLLLENTGRREALALLDDPLLEKATRAISYDPRQKDRTAYERECNQKTAARKQLIYRYTTGGTGLTSDNVELILNSIGDNRSFLLENLVPVQSMLGYLRRFFKPDSHEPDYSLAITEGEKGARLTHSHTRQYRYVEQSLELWAEILNNFFELWWLADQDMLSLEHRYQLTDTGQGNQRVQSAPLVERRMRIILAKVQERCGEWIGSSVVHLGDRNVPNALHFIDKYTQVARILNPIICTLRWLEANYERKSRVENYVNETFGSIERALCDILVDFFRYAFDGSGATNFYDAGSCTDGRLTSAWHWCSAIETKPFYPAFLLAGFASFDGGWEQ
jgi:hypothetical protein